MAHTAEPWFVGAMNDCLFVIDRPPRPSNDDVVPGRDVTVIAKLDYAGAADNANRVVACVNACAGIPTEALEADAVRDLVAAAGMALAALETCGNLAATPERLAAESNARAALKAIIARAEGRA